MADPFRIFYDGATSTYRRVRQQENVALIIRHDPMYEAVRLIGYYELRVWFEPNWRQARRLAALFPHTVIFSIPEESDTPSLQKTPGWRSARKPPPAL